MDYDIEREKQKSNEIRKAFREMFPLCMEHELPWDVCQIADFLKRRIEIEVRENTDHFVQSIARVLCEVTRPKTHMVDMARIIVEEVKTFRSEQGRNKERLEKAKETETERDEILGIIREIGKLVGCNHTEDKDGRMKLAQCIEDVLKANVS